MVILNDETLRHRELVSELRRVQSVVNDVRYEVFKLRIWAGTVLIGVILWLVFGR